MSLNKPTTNPLDTSQVVSPRFNKVVLLDDSDIDMFINETILNAIGIANEVRKEAFPKKLLESLRNTKLLSDVPELIFLDLNIPDMSGLDFLSEFNKLSDFIKSKCKIVVITSTVEPEIKNHILMNPSVVRFLTKPLDVFQLNLQV